VRESRSVLTVQYLEGGHDWSRTDPAAVRARLRDALARLRVDAVAVGWGVPPRLVDACADEAARAGAALYRWHVLLAGDGAFVPRSEWRVVGPSGEPVPGHGGSADFTFVCPNRPESRAAVLAHLDAVAADGPWAGLMLDRMRFPSPAGDPATRLGCFCDACDRAAAAESLHLAAVRAGLVAALATAEGRRAVATGLLGCHTREGVRGVRGVREEIVPLDALIAFRARSVAGLIEEAAALLRGRGLRLGLDCFSPSLAPMVGQELAALGPRADWVTVMTYGHALGPAGMPFELAALCDWLVATGSADEPAAMSRLADAAGLPLPATVAALRAAGIPPSGLADEARRARTATRTPVLAGIELVDVPGLCALSDEQIRADLAAFRGAAVDGLALSWELWRIPPERLDMVAAEA
jgi:hypothetical protein